MYAGFLKEWELFPVIATKKSVKRFDAVANIVINGKKRQFVFLKQKDLQSYRFIEYVRWRIESTKHEINSTNGLGFKNISFHPEPIFVLSISTVEMLLKIMEELNMDDYNFIGVFVIDEWLSEPESYKKAFAFIDREEIKRVTDFENVGWDVIIKKLSHSK